MHQTVRALALAMAVLGGAVLCALILLTCLSILGREIGSAFPATGFAPITGDFELVEAGMAFVLFAFLPLAQIDRAHATVDLFTARFSAAGQRRLAAVIEVVFAAVLILLAAQLFAGTLSKHASGQTSFLLQFPVWWAYAASCLGASLAALTGVYLALQRLRALALGRDLLPPSPGEQM